MRPFSVEEARAAGISLRALAGSSWRRLARGMYCWTGLEENPWDLLVAWGASLPPHSSFAGFTAAWLHGADVVPCNPIEVWVAPSCAMRTRPGLHVRHMALRQEDMVTVRGLMATSVRRTFRDLSRRLSPVEFLVLADEALRLGLGRFHQQAEPAESPMETRLRWLLIQGGLPRPQVQTELRNEEGRFLGRADLYYPTARLAVEYDGGNHRDRLVEDNRRQNRLLSAGFKLLRFTASDVHQRGDMIKSLVSKALA